MYAAYVSEKWLRAERYPESLRLAGSNITQDTETNDVNDRSDCEYINYS